MSKALKVFSLADPIKGASADLLGGKGYNLWKMAQAGVRVPPAVILPTSVCREYMKNPETVLKWLEGVVVPGILTQFDYELVSVRSGAKFSMPGMMDTILNVGIDAKTSPLWFESLGEECASDCQRRLVEMYAEVVRGIPRQHFEGLTGERALRRYWSLTQEEFPSRREQLLDSIVAVFRSWNNDRAKTYRKLNGISDSLGTAVVIQKMVFGNLNDESCTGVMFTRNPSTGENAMVGEWLVNAQGEDVVAGIVTPRPLIEMQDWNESVFDELMIAAHQLEGMNRDMQDVEFTVENGKLYILQTRNAKRTAQAALKVACEFFSAGVISVDELKDRVTLSQFLSATRPDLHPAFKEEPVVTGLGASSGIAIGRAVFSSEDALKCKDPCILIAKETTPDDIAGMHAAVGILTSTGGATSHAAVVARGMDKVCVVGAEDMKVIEFGAVIGNRVICEGEVISLCGHTGRVWLGPVPLVGGADNVDAQALVGILREETKALTITLKVEEVQASGTLFVLATTPLAQQGEVLAKVIDRMESGIIDLRSLAVMLPEEDGLLFGSLQDSDTGGVLNTLLTTPAKPGIKLLTGGVPAPKQWGVIGYSGGSLESLLFAEGFVVMEEQPSAEVTKLLQLKKAAGEEVSCLNLGYFGEGVAALTNVQLVQALLKT